MPNTITVYNSFIAGTKARASEVNQNFSNHRGTLVPIEELTAAASNNTHDLGAPTHQWNNLYVNNAPYINGSQQIPTPTGAFMPFAGTSAPSGFLICDGSAVSRATYAALFAVIAEYWGVGDLSTTFNLPDLRGRVIRNKDSGIARDPDRAARSSSLTLFTGANSVTINTITQIGFTTATVSRLRVGFRAWSDTTIMGIPTCTIVSINTATNALTFSLTATAATTTANYKFDAGGDNIGSTQLDAFQGHWHQYYAGAFNGNLAGGSTFERSFDNNQTTAETVGTLNHVRQANTDNINGTPRTTSETRMINIYANHIIKY